MFELHPNLQKKEYVCDLPFCKVLFEDNANCPWIFLIPRKNNVKSMLDLTTDERITLMKEIELAERTMARLFNPDQTNVAMIGNVTQQLHVHIICRYKTDAYWPDTVWGQPAIPYFGTTKQDIIAKIKKELETCQK